MKKRGNRDAIKDLMTTKAVGNTLLENVGVAGSGQEESRGVEDEGGAMGDDRNSVIEEKKEANGVGTASSIYLDDGTEGEEKKKKKKKQAPKRMTMVSNGTRREGNRRGFVWGRAT